MKIGKIMILTVSTGLLIGMINGCGGGSSDTSTATLTELTPESAEKMVVSVAEVLPGCSYNSDTVATTSSKYLDVINKSVLMEIIEVNKGTVPVLAADIIDNTISGNCPTAPGSYTVNGTHEDGIDDLTYTFNNYCLGDDIENLTLSGTADVKNVATPTPTGPIPQYNTISTGTDGIAVIEKNAEGTYTRNVKVSDLKYTYGDDDIVVIDNITYTDSENASVNISSTGITTSQDNVIIEGEITVMGSNDTQVTMPLSSSVVNSFDLIIDGQILGVMDCSGL